MKGAALLIFSLRQSASFGILYDPPLYFLHTSHWLITALTVARPCGIQYIYLIWDNVCEVPTWNNRLWNSLINNVVQCSFFSKYIGFFVYSGRFIVFVNLPWHLMILSLSNCKPSELIMLSFDELLFMIHFLVLDCTCRIHCFLAFLSSLSLSQSLPLFLCYG